jgi:hypothetical protein
MRKILSILCFLSFLCFLPLSATAQTQTNVTATVKDPLGIPYANGKYTIQLVPAGGAASVNGAQIGGSFNGSTDANGSFNVSLWPNASITTNPPGSSQWQFTVCVSPGVLPPLGIGGACTPPTSVTISGASQSLSSTLSAVAPQLTTISLGGSGVTSVTGSAPIVSSGGATPAISCPTCNTSSATIAGTIANTQVAFGTGANTIGGNAGFTFVTPNLTIPTSGGYQINGVNALFTGPAANSNLSVNSVAFPALTTGTFNTAVGDQTTMPAVTSGTLNVAVGATNMGLTTTGQQNTAVGTAAMQSEGAAASFNTALGAGSLKIVTSNNNTAVGQAALQSLTSGTQDTAVGAGSGSNTTGSGNTLVGFSVGNNLTTGSNNTMMGIGLGGTVTTGSNNIAIGNTLATITPASSNQLDIGDVITGTAINTPSSSTITMPGTLTGATTSAEDFSAQTGANSFKVPSIANCSPTQNAAICFNSNNYFIGEAANQNAIFLVESATRSANVISKNAITGFPIQSASSITDDGTTVTTTEPVNATAYQTATNCKANGTAANPSVAACGSAAAGMFSCATNASTGTCQVNTTAVTANSEITITQDAADGGAGQLNVTCNTGNVLSATAPVLASKNGGTSFTINLGTVTTNPGCFEYTIKN